MIIEHVKIYDPTQAFDPQQDYHVTIEGEEISAIDKGPYRGDQETIDGQGRVLAPSFNDSHMHLLRYGLLKHELDLTEVTSWKEMKQLVENHYKEMKEGDWIFGKGFNDSQFDDIDHLLTAEDLDEIQVKAYVYFLHEDGHECVISEKALELLKEEENFKKEPDVFKETDENGNWNGRFKDTAVHYIKRHFWGRDVEDAQKCLKAAFPHLSKHGITSVHTDDLNFIKSYDNLWKAYTELEGQGLLPIDVHLHHYVFNIHDIHEYLEEHQNRTGDGTDQVKVGAFKIFLDGTQRLHTSAMRNPYPDNSSTTGVLVYTQEQLNEMLRVAGENGMQVAMHAIGDRAVEQAIVALEQPEARTNDLRHRIIHAQTLAPDLVDRLSAIRPYIETQPSFLLGEWNQKHLWAPEELLPYCDAFQRLLNADIPITLSSDLPIGALNPLISIYAGVNRMDLEGKPEGGWMPQEKLSIQDAWKGFTETPAELEYRESGKGKIQPGYQADFVLLDGHPLETAKDSIHEIKVIETWHRGKKVFE